MFIIKAMAYLLKPKYLTVTQKLNNEEKNMFFIIYFIEINFFCLKFIFAMK